jgi:DNA-directed RNA polymerase specialized sigma24 family protein
MADIAASDPCDGLIQQEEEAAVRRALHRMPPSRAKEAMVLRHLRGFSVKETATIMRITSGAVKGYTSEGLSIVRAILEDEHDEGASR